MNNEFEKRPVFICGHPKAGTSLITALLDGHPEVLVYPEETLFFRRFLPAIKGKPIDEAIEIANRLLIHIFEWNLENPPEHQRDYPDRDYSDFDVSRIREEFKSFLTSRKLEEKNYLFAALYAYGIVSNRANPNTRCWVEKTPYNEFYTKQIFDWWPAAKCIHIVRDPRDNFLSYQRKQPDWTAEMFAWNWTRSIKAGLENRDIFGSSRYLIIRFEDLLNDAIAVTRQVATFIGISWEESLLRPTRAGDSWGGNSMFDQKFQQISNAPVGRWEERIKSEDLAVLQSIARYEMEAMNYPLVDMSGLHLDLLTRLKIFREALAARVKHFHK